MPAATENPFAPCTTCTCAALRRATRALTRHYDLALRPTGLRATQFNLAVAEVEVVERKLRVEGEHAAQRHVLA